MANDLVVKLTVNSKEFENGLENAKRKMKGVEGSAAIASASFKKLIGTVTKFAGSLGAAVTVGNALSKNLKEIETVSDSVARSQKVLNESIKTLFVNVNTNSFSNFISGLKEVVKNAKEAYDAVDNLGTYLNFSSADAAKNQSEQAKARYMIQGIKKGVIEGDIDFWQKELERLSNEAEGIIDKEIKHYEDAIAASDKLLFSKFKGREGQLAEFKDKYSGTADKNEAAQQQYAKLSADRKEIIRLFGKHTNPNTAPNSMYIDWMKHHGDELEFLEIVIKREQDLSEMNKLLIAQENKKAALYNEKRTNLRYLTGEEGTSGGGGGGGGGSSSMPSFEALTPEQLGRYYFNMKTLTGYQNVPVEEEEIFEPDTEALLDKIAGEKQAWQERIKNLNEYSSALSSLSTTFQALSSVAADGSPWAKFTAVIGGILGQIGSLISTYAQLVSIEAVAESIKAGHGIPFPFNLALIAAAGTTIAGIISTISSQTKNAGTYANGGIVPGTSYSGDKLWARVNSGEMILNRQQQAALFGGRTNDVHFVIEGSQLQGVLDNYSKTQNL